MSKFFRTFLLLGILAAANTATAATVHLRPNPNSPVLGEMSEEDLQFAAPAQANLSAQQKEAGWQAISHLDDFRGFVRRTDLTKDLLVSPGAPVYFTANSGNDNILTHAAANDTFEVEALAENWVEVSFRKPVTGFVRPNAPSTANPAPAAPAPAIADSNSQIAPLDEPEMPVFEDIEPALQTTASRAQTVSDRNAIPRDGTMRLYEGRLRESRSFLFNKPPYPFQIVDSSGNRIAYVDLEKLLITTPLDRFIDRLFLVYGQAEPIEGRRDFVIRVEHLRLK